jgi:hypothetical protein
MTPQAIHTVPSLPRKIFEMVQISQTNKRLAEQIAYHLSLSIPPDYMVSMYRNGKLIGYISGLKLLIINMKRSGLLC